MPSVAGVQYPHITEGIAAQQVQSPPLTSPSHPMARRRPDLQPLRYGGSGGLIGGILIRGQIIEASSKG